MARATKVENFSQAACAAGRVSGPHSMAERWWTVDRAQRTATAGYSSVSAPIDRTLPRDLDIFSPLVVTQALWTQWRAKPQPAPWDWACSFSWCGKRRSMPPPWMSNSSPR